MRIKIALIGKMRSGKDTVGKWLIEDYGFKKFAFGTAIGRVIHEYFPEAFADGKPRKHYQLIGQTFRQLNPDVWINQMLRDIDIEKRRAYPNTFNIVITDVRQENEVKALRELGYTIVKVEADDDIRIDRIIKSGDVFNIHDLQHETEVFSDLVDADYTIVNNGTKEELKQEVLNIINKLKNE